MNAHEFVKQYGMDRAKNIVNNIPSKYMACYHSLVCYDIKSKKYSDRFKPREDLVNMAWLKRIVESHELVEQYGGLGGAKKKLNGLCIFRWITPEITALERAITDFEACQ